MVAFYTISSLLWARKFAFCCVINSICYLSCYLPALKTQQRCNKALLISYRCLPLKNQLLRRAGIQARALISFLCCSHGRLFKRALNQDRAVKRAYTLLQNAVVKLNILVPNELNLTKNKHENQILSTRKRSKFEDTMFCCSTRCWQNTGFFYFQRTTCRPFCNFHAISPYS